MAFRIGAGEAVGPAVQRIAAEQLDRALAEVADGGEDVHERVHAVRKRCKQLRALLRLARDPLERDETYARENAWLRDAARELSGLRDAHTLLVTARGLEDHGGSLEGLRRALRERRDRALAGGVDERLERARERLEQARDRVDAWRLEADGFEALEGGLLRTYARCRRAMVHALDDPSTERFHAWRKRVKYHWQHLRLLRSVWPGPMEARADEAHALADALGEDHDLAVLRETVLAAPDEHGGEQAALPALEAALRRQLELRATARGLGARLCAESPKRLGQRLGTYWEAWREPRSGRS